MESKLITNQTQWNALLTNQPEAQFLQSWEWGEFQKALGRAMFRLGVEQNGMLVAGAQCIVRNHGFGIRSLTIYRGPVVDNKLTLSDYTACMEQLLRDITALAKQEGVTLIHAEPPIQTMSPAAHFFTPSLQWEHTFSDQPNATWLLSLSKSAETLEAQLHQKTRYNIRLAEKKGVDISNGDLSNIDTFLKLLHATSRRNRIQPHEDRYYQTMVETLLPAGVLHLAKANYQSRPLAMNIVIYFGDTVAYVHGASGNEDRNVMAPYLLQWSEIQAARASGARWYDFGGVVPESSQSHPWFGISRFKRGFGGEERRFIGGRERPMRSLLYNIVQLRRRLRR